MGPAVGTFPASPGPGGIPAQRDKQRTGDLPRQCRHKATL